MTSSPASTPARRHDIDISQMHLRFKGTLEDADELLGILQAILKPSIIQATVKDLTSEREWASP